MSKIERAFATLQEGQVHLRRLPGAAGAQPPIVLLHASPVSSWSMEGLMLALQSGVDGRTIIAPDTLGNGDSVSPAPDNPNIGYFADSVRRLLDVLGIERVAIYGAHTGARIACEFAAQFPQRTTHLVFDGITEYDDDMRQQIIDNYAPRVPVDEYGRHMIWAFNFVRDQALHFPYFMRDPAHRLANTMPPATVLNRAALDVLKALDTYWKPYIAAFQYRAYERMPLVQAPTLLLKPDTELPVLNAAVSKAASLLHRSQVAVVAGTDASKAAAIAQFLRT
jgi:pimeloyl-ACP methyl ester carboxylesterase